ncbi:MAG TPA: hypothetical protein ENJ95_10575 [Bacteroidetes bacterium]|nr:hypothetical protein [Bacteroidota bacterium]
MKNKNLFYLKGRAFKVFFAGTMLMALPFVVKHIFNMPENLEDFIRGFGVALIVGSLFLQKKQEREAAQQQK